MNDVEPLSSSDSDEKQEEYDGSSIDDLGLKELRSGKNRSIIKLNDKIMETVFYNLAHGVSLSACAMYVGVCPATILKWYKKGMEEVNKLSESGYEFDDESDVNLSDYGRFYIGADKAKSKCIIEISNMLYDRCSETGKEYVAMWLLERQEPEKYNLKYKAQQDINAGNTEKNTITFEFVNGFNSRPPEAQEYISEKLDELHERYGDAPNSGVKKDED